MKEEERGRGQTLRARLQYGSRETSRGRDVREDEDAQ